MQKEIAAFFHRMARLFEEGQVSGLLEVFNERIPVYSDTGLTLRSTLRDTEVSIRRLMAAAHRKGATRLRHRIVSTRPSKGGGSTVVRIEWLYCDARDECVETGDVNYYCGPDRDGALRILMIEYIKVAFPDAISEMPRDDLPPKRLH